MGPWTKLTCSLDSIHACLRPPLRLSQGQTRPYFVVLAYVLSYFIAYRSVIRERPFAHERRLWPHLGGAARCP